LQSPARSPRAENINAKNSVGKDFDRTIITTGAQQGIDLLVKSLVNEGEGIICENPSFIGSLNSMRSYRAELYGVEIEKDGINIEKVEELLKTKNVKLIYTIPTFQNPTGITQSLEKRKKLLELAEKYDCYILEDNPYGDLRFTGEAVAPIKSLDTNGRVIYVGSFSKILSPGMRLGYVVANEEFANRIEVVKQANDVHTPLLTQMMATEFIKRYDIEEYIEKGRELYGRRALRSRSRSHWHQRGGSISKQPTCTYPCVDQNN
jgi:2-aminoadipate transaminase